MDTARLGIRWTLGDVSNAGFEALRFSIWGAYRLFGPGAAYAVCVNSIELSDAHARTGPVPDCVSWLDGNQGMPDWLRPHLDAGFAEGVAWKFAPLHLFPDRHELSLDNDCVLWGVPTALRSWLDDARPAVLVAEDVKACFGQFAALVGDAPRNLGIRGLPPHVDFAAALRAVLREHPVTLRSELDEQGLQLAALARLGNVHVVSVEEVTICSPFPPHREQLGRCGAHFCGLNAKQLGFAVAGRPGEQLVRDHWQRHRRDVLARVRAPSVELHA